jgi:pimeloyl-ACP methyl ester carboxylesterase
MLHGWPSSFVQILPIVPFLTTGANPFDVVVISLPGYGFSDRPRQRGMDITRIADIVVEVMAQLDYPRSALAAVTSAPAYCNNSRSTIPTGSSR